MDNSKDAEQMPDDVSKEEDALRLEAMCIVQQAIVENWVDPKVRRILLARPQKVRKTIEESIADINRRFPKTMAYLKDH